MPSEIKGKTTKVNKGQAHCYNKFQLLADQTDNGETMEYTTDEEETEQEHEVTGKQTKNKMKKPPPLVIHGKIDSHLIFVKAIKDITNEDFHIKYHEEITEVFYH